MEHLPSASSAGLGTTKGRGSAGVPIAALRLSIVPRSSNVESPPFAHESRPRSLETARKACARAVGLQELPAPDGTGADVSRQRRDYERGPLMSGTHLRPPLANYTDAVAVLIERGETFGAVGDAIDE